MACSAASATVPLSMSLIGTPSALVTAASLMIVTLFAMLTTLAATMSATMVAVLTFNFLQFMSRHQF